MRDAVRRTLLAFFAGAALSTLTACASSRSVNQVLADPSRYANHEVSLSGQVVRSTSALGTGAYELDDGTGRVWVVSRRGVPRKGARVKVTGTVRDAYDIGGIVKLPDVVANGLVVMESHHKATGY
jgi:hypothetical protein